MGFSLERDKFLFHKIEALTWKKTETALKYTKGFSAIKHETLKPWKAILNGFVFD